MVAAMEREVQPLIAGWHSSERGHEGRTFKFFEKKDNVLVCGGMGGAAARHATEAVIALYSPAMVCSVGFAGALQPELKVGDLVVPQRVLDARDGSSAETAGGTGILVTVDFVAGKREKIRLAAAYNGLAADMEAAHVARGAQARGVPFSAVKAISDDFAFAMPPLQRFVGDDGQFQTSRFVRFAMFRPLLWPQLVRLARNSRHAAAALSDHLGEMIAKSAPEPGTASDTGNRWSVVKSR